MNASRLVTALIFCVMTCLSVGAQTARPLARVMLIPLDDRPPCLQFTQLIGQIGDAEIVAPPRSLLGRFTEAGRPEEIARWAEEQDLSSFDAMIVSVDMLAYGGLVNSRVHRTPLEVALRRVELVRRLRARAPRVPVYGFNVVMRLAPTGDGRNDAYRDKLSRWAEISPEASAAGAVLREEVARLEREIPAEALADYKRARERNYAVNRESVELVRRGVFDYLILSQDDAKPRGVHVADRERLIALTQDLRLGDRVAVQPGADEVANLLLARALCVRFGYKPRVLARYSSEAIRTSVAPFEDRPLHRTVSFHINAAGGREVTTERDADIVFYVYGSRAEKGVAEKFAAEVARGVDLAGKQIVVADIDFKGDVQGADPAFTEDLLRRNLFPRFAGYAAWNTAGNTIGTALPHGVVAARVFAAAPRYDRARRARIARAQAKFLLHRLIDDYAYHSLVRPETHRHTRTSGLSRDGLDGRDKEQIEEYIRARLRPQIDRLWGGFADRPIATLSRRSSQTARFAPSRLGEVSFTLPWGRTFEAEIDFDLEVTPIRR